MFCNQDEFLLWKVQLHVVLLSPPFFQHALLKSSRPILPHPQMISLRLGRRHRLTENFFESLISTVNEISRFIPPFSVHTLYWKNSRTRVTSFLKSDDSSLLQNYYMSKHIRVNNIVYKLRTQALTCFTHHYNFVQRQQPGCRDNPCSFPHDWDSGPEVHIHGDHLLPDFGLSSCGSFVSR